MIQNVASRMSPACCNRPAIAMQYRLFLHNHHHHHSTSNNKNARCFHDSTTTTNNCQQRRIHSGAIHCRRSTIYSAATTTITMRKFSSSRHLADRMDPYSVLGVDPSASKEEIKKRYLELVKKYHPDTNNNNNNTGNNEKFCQIQEAFESIQKMNVNGAGGYAYASNTSTTAAGGSTAGAAASMDFDAYIHAAQLRAEKQERQEDRERDRRLMRVMAINMIAATLFFMWYIELQKRRRAEREKKMWEQTSPHDIAVHQELLRAAAGGSAGTGEANKFQRQRRIEAQEPAQAAATSTTTPSKQQQQQLDHYHHHYQYNDDDAEI